MAKRRVLRSAVAVALVAGVVAATGGVDSAVSATQMSSPAASSTSPLDVVVGETVAVTTDPSGSTTPLNVYLLNGQVSGNGSGDVVVPTGPNNQTQNQSVSSSSGDVNSFFKLGGTYKGNLPVSVTSTVKVNGQPVASNDAYNLNGDVEITFTATNNTSRTQTVTYKDLNGATQTAQMDIPVPFGDSLQVMFGDGWDVIDTGTGTAKPASNGTQVMATLILFPVIQGLAGGTTQSVTVKARAQNANLPSATHTVVPIQLQNYQNGQLLSLAPMVENKAVEPIAGMLGDTVNDVLLATRIISGYTSGFRQLDSGYIDPLAKDIQKLTVNPKGISNSVAELADGLTALGTVLKGDATAKGEIAGVILQISNYIGKNVPDTIEWLTSVIQEVGPDAAAASKSLASLNTILQSIDITALDADVKTVAQMCSTVGATATYFGGTNPTLPPYPGLSDGAKALSDGISALSNGTDKNVLKALQTQLQEQSKNSYAQKLWQYRNLMPADLKPLGASAACVVTDSILGPVASEADQIQAYLAPASQALGQFAAFAASPQLKTLEAEVLADVNKLNLILNNPSCTNAEIIGPIEAAIKKYGIANLEKNAVPIVQAILKNCGLVQVMEFFGGVDLTISDVSTGAATLLRNLSKDTPKVVNGVNKVKNLAGIAGRVFDAIPGIGDLVQGKVDTAALGLEGKGDALLVKVSDLVGKTQASLVAMNERGIAGDGAPYGNSTLAPGTNGKITNYATYQITTEEASPYARSWGISIGIAVVFLLLALGLGTYLFRRRINP